MAQIIMESLKIWNQWFVSKHFM